MNLDQYLSLICLAHAHSAPSQPADEVPMSEEEKFYHYQTLKRWMSKYKRQNPQIADHLKCECHQQIQKCVNDSPLNSRKSTNIETLNEFSKQQNKDQIQDKETNYYDYIAVAFLKRVKVLFQSDRSYLKRLIKRLQMDISIKQLKLWLQQHSPQSYGQNQIQYVKNLINCCNKKSIILRIIMRQFLQVSSRLSILTKKRQGRHDLRLKLGNIRKLKESLFELEE